MLKPIIHLYKYTFKYLGENKWDLKKFNKVFKSKKRVFCAPPAPPEGLFLTRIIY